MDTLKKNITEAIDEGLTGFQFVAKACHREPLESEKSDPEFRMASSLFRLMCDWIEARKDLLDDIQQAQRRAEKMEKEFTETLCSAHRFTSFVPNENNEIGQTAKKLQQIENNLRTLFYILGISTDELESIYQAMNK
jgi:hypothetical protein